MLGQTTPRQLTPGSNLDNLKKEAKRWLKALRAADGQARARFKRAYSDAPAQPCLRDVQHALALEHGFDRWTALKDHLAAGVRVDTSHAELVESFLKNASLDWRVGGSMRISARHTAERLLRRHPEIARDSIYTAVVCGDLEEVERLLAERPETASKSGGTREWPPLLYLCSARLSLPAASDNAVAIARALLDRGADPNAYYPGGSPSIHYTALTCVAGEGEEDATPHPQREALARLLLERGAEPYDGQVIYNIHFHGNVLWFVEIMYEFSVKGGRQADWYDPNWSMLDQRAYGSGARWHLDIAVTKNDVELAEWLLAHGAGPNAAAANDPRFLQRTLYEEAQRRGFTEIAELLVRFGATPSAPVVLEGVEAFAAACFRLDRAEALALLAEHPKYLLSPMPMFAAAKRDRADVVEFLLDLGVSIEIEDEKKTRPLHVAAGHDSLRVATLLIERGAEIEPVELNWNNTPLDNALYENLPRMIEFLSRFTRDVFRLTWIGNIEHLREVLNAEPDLAKVVDDGNTPLMWLPDDEARAKEIVELLVACGADPTIRNKEGQTASECATKRGMYDAAEILRSAATTPTAETPTASTLARPSLEQFESLAEDLVEAYDIDWKNNMIRLRRRLSEKDADAVIDLLNEKQISALSAEGYMTDALLARLSDLDHLTRLELQGSKQLTDAGLPHLAGLARLQYLDLSGSRISDPGLEVLRQLPELRTFKLYHHGDVSDAGVANLSQCEHLEHVDLMGTPTGDGAIRALAGKPRLRRFHAGSSLTDSGIALFHEFPVFKTWQGGEVALSLMEFAPEPNYLWLNLKAPFTNKGLANMAGLDGLFALNLFGSTGMGPFDDSNSVVTATGLSRLVDLPNLGWLGCCAGLGNDESMRHISAMPQLRMLSCQDAVAGDDGFAALSRSRTIEYIWGRRCHNLTGLGFAALAAMPALRGLSVSCRNVDDQGLSALPRFPALREFMPMDVRDNGFRHVGRCEQLEALECMHCNSTTDIATGHIAGLTKLKSYRAWSTRITDRSLEILGRMLSLERLLFYDCAGVTDAGMAFVAGLPRLREVNLESLPSITSEGVGIFPVNVRVNIST